MRGIYGSNCRLKTGGSGYSTHAWGAAIDTNTARNPYGQDHWDGKGAFGNTIRFALAANRARDGQLTS